MDFYRACPDKSMKVCEHVLTMAHVSGNLNEFAASLRRTRKRPNMMDIIVQRGPKSACRKPSKRKCSNSKALPLKNMSTGLISKKMKTSYH